MTEAGFELVLVTVTETELLAALLPEWHSQPGGAVFLKVALLPAAVLRNGCFHSGTCRALLLTLLSPVPSGADEKQPQSSQ